MRTPNPEQKLAIEHTGGVLLSAGAGSGKTFVLENHIIYLTAQWIEEFAQSGQPDFSSYIRKKFKQTVMMTFTKKAAGELELRIKRAFELKAQTGVLWEQALAEISALTVGTIHSFCFKLISQGFFPHLPVGEDVLSEGEFQSMMEELFDQWLSFQEGGMVNLFHRNRKSLVQSLQNIMGEPALRESWQEASYEALTDLDPVVEILFSEFGLKGTSSTFNLASHSEHEKKTWFKFLEDYLQHNRNFVNNEEGLLAAISYFAAREFKMPATPRGKTVSPEVISFYTKVKALKDFCKEYGEHFSAFNEKKEEIISAWFGFIQNMVNWIEREYSRKEGLTFSDLEFYVLQGLRNPSTAKIISDQYKYFVVDEFQDTSHVQFEILRLLIQEDFSRLFCVGDVKQAIYGFRGGELGVFMECSKKMAKNLSLKNNYRSLASIINFNNQFFEQILSLGYGFSGDDEHRVAFEAQAVPDSTTESGAITQINVKPAESEEKINNLELNLLEAEALLWHVKQLPKSETKAILYSKLAPSFFLISGLIENDIGFTAQVKIPFLDDPIIGMFFCLIEKDLNSNEETKSIYLKFMIQQYLTLLGAEADRFSHVFIEEFDKEKKYFGLLEAYKSFVAKLGIANANYKHNFDFIEELVLNQVETEAIFLKLNQQSDKASSMEFKYGKNSHLVRIMTTHASKGLEFDHVLLGGIYTNDSRFPENSLVGKTPMSFRWSPSVHGKKKYKTPHMILEDQIAKYKDFSESKRLFYVANTRAVKTLSWINIDFSERKRSRDQANCWYKGILAGLEHVKTPVEQLTWDGESTNWEKFENRVPMFHINNLGINFCSTVEKSFLLPELSVTRLAQVEICPRRYYFSNICKISEDEVSLLENTITLDQEVSEETISSSDFTNSAQRGSAVHEAISLLIKGDYLPDQIDLKAIDLDKAHWAVEKVQAIGDKFEYFSENQIKFEVLNYMISGIPDLYAVDRERKAIEIWDFKTGKFSDEKLPPYWFQLYCYASAMYAIYPESQNYPIKLVLCFVDEEKIVEQKVSLEGVDNYLRERINLTQSPWVKKTENCTFCPYQTICEQ